VRCTAPPGGPCPAGAVAPHEGVITWRRLYVPQVGHAVWGSLGSRHCGQRTSAGAAAFHCARRDRVLLRDILLLGTATSVLLTCFRHGRAVRVGLGHHAL
jgi:hypothetical protein